MFSQEPQVGQWIPTWPRATVGAFVMALLVWGGGMVLLYQYQWTALQRYYLKPYVRSTIGAALGVPKMPYRFVNVYDARGRRLAVNAEVIEVALTSGGYGLAPSAQAVAAGVRYVAPVESAPMYHAGVNDLIRRTFYRGRSPFRLMDPAGIFAGSVLAAMLLFAVPMDVRRLRQRRKGRRIRGPELMTVAAFNAASHSRQI